MRRTRRSRGVALLAGVVLALGSVVTSASAQSARLYATYGPEDRGPGGPIGILPNVTMTLHLWLWGGDSVSVAPPPCTTGATGSEICGVSFFLQPSGGFQLLGFVGDPNFDSSGGGLPFVVSLAPPPRLSANAFDLGVPTPANRHLGTVTLLGVGITPSSTVSVGGGVVGSNLEMRGLVNESIFVPEPAFAAGLVMGVLLLAGVGSCRRGLFAGRAPG